MGIYLNPGNSSFYNAVNHSHFYVDKTLLIGFTNSVLFGEQKNVCVSRPRRFGKSMAAEMLVAYYSRGCDSRELFQNLKIAQHPSFEKHLNKYHVIHLNIPNFLEDAEDAGDLIRFIKEDLLDELLRTFPDVQMPKRITLTKALATIFDAVKIPFVFIIDEWDCIFREYKSDTAAQEKYLTFLRNILKDQPYAALVYMTGILPIKKYGQHSALNMFDEYCMTNQRDLAEFTGFTDDEVRKLCDRYRMDFEMAKRWYDGYNLKGMSIYNPRSVVASMTGGDFDSYWTKTETYESLKKYIQMDIYGLQEIVTKLIAGEHCPVNSDKFQNDMVTFNSADDVLTLLIHLGYLTYDFDTETAWIPNAEVQREFINSIEDGGWEHIMHSIQISDKLLEATLQGNADRVAEIVEQVHQENTSILKYNDENSLACVISLAYYSARRKYCMIRELPTGKGFADVVLIPYKNTNSPAIVVELKYKKSAESAIEQIKRKGYCDALEGFSGEILLVGISYDGEKKHTCVIEKIRK